MVDEYRRLSEDEVEFYLHKPITEEEYEKMKENKITALELIVQINDTALHEKFKEKILKLLQKIFELKNVLIDVLQDKNVHTIINKAVNSEDEVIKNFIAVQLKAIASQELKSNNTLKNKSIDNELFNALGLLATSKNSSVSENALDAIILCLESNVEMIDIFLSNDFFNLLKAIALQNENNEEKARLLSVFVRLGKISAKLFDRIKEENIFTEILKILSNDKNDFLFQALALHLIEELAEYDIGRYFLLESENLRKLIFVLKDSIVEESTKCRIIQVLSLIIFYLPGEINYILKESDDIVIEVLNRYLCKEEDITQDNEVYLLLCIVSWSYICSRQKSCEVLHEKLSSISDSVSAKVQHFKEEVSTAALLGWTKILNNEFKEVSEYLIKSIKNVLLPTLLNVTISKPFPEFRVNFYELLKHMCKWDWVAQSLVDSIEFKSLILNFSSESDYNCIIKKHEFVSKFVSLNSDLIVETWTKSVLNKINEYVKLGPFNLPKDDVSVDKKAM